MNKPDSGLEGVALLVVDMINAYLREGEPQYSRECRSVITKVREATAYFKARGGLVVFCNTELESERDPMARKWGLHATRGTDSSEVVDELAPHSNDLIYGKKTYSAFSHTELAGDLRLRDIHTTVLCGIHTHACVLLTAAGAFDHGFDVVLLEDCMTTAYRENHSTRLRFFRSHIGKVMTLGEFKTLFEARSMRKKPVGRSGQNNRARETFAIRAGNQKDTTGDEAHIV